jgi:hypothetical protein
MADTDIHHDSVHYHRPAISAVNWSAAVWASIIAGLVFAVLEVLMVALLQGKSPWAPLHMIGAIALGPGAMATPDSFDIGIIAIAVVVHMVLAVIYGLVLAIIVAQTDTGLAVAIGAAFGLALYAINFYGFTRWFPWFADARDWISIFNHIVQSALMAYLYKVFDKNHAGAAMEA